MEHSKAIWNMDNHSQEQIVIKFIVRRNSHELERSCLELSKVVVRNTHQEQSKTGKGSRNSQQ